MADSDLSSNSSESKLNDTEINEIFVQEIINNEFDNIEDWVDKEFITLKRNDQGVIIILKLIFLMKLIINKMIRKVVLIMKNQMNKIWN